MGSEGDFRNPPLSSEVSAVYYHSRSTAPKSTPKYFTDTELYNLELEWLKALPHSDQQLRGKLFKGWWQTEDITSTALHDHYMHEGQIDMKAIIDDIPRYIVSCRGLESPAQSSHPLKENGSTTTTSHDTDDKAETDSRPLVHMCPDCRTPSSTPHTLYIMLDYLVELSIPKHYLKHFSLFQNKVQNSSPRSRPQSAHRSAQRWVFTACHCAVSASYGNLFHTLTDFVPVLVVEFDAFQSFVEVCSKQYVIVRLPPARQNTTGYTKYWIQQIARKLLLQQIWILDDQVKSLYRTVPCQRLPLVRQGETWQYDTDMISSRLASFSTVIKHLERVMLNDEENNPNNHSSILGISNEICALVEPYCYNIPYGMVLLNLRNLKDIKFHPELHQIEDQVLSCEAVKAGQRVFVSNSFVLLDSNWDVT